MERERSSRFPVAVEQNGISVAFVDFWYIEETLKRGSENWAVAFTSMGKDGSFLAIQT